MNEIEIKVLTLPHGKDLPLPEYGTAESAGMDLVAATQDPIILEPGKKTLVATGICLAIPSGYEGQVRPRSGLAAKHGITVLNTPGTIDADYRGEILVILVNLGEETFTITRGMRIAQIVFAPVTKGKMTKVSSFDEETERGEGGFGSTGLYAKTA